MNATTNLVVQAVRKMDLRSWLPFRELSSWSDYADHTTAIRGRLQGFLGAKTKAVIPGVAHGGAVPNVGHAESARWLRALSRESRLLRWIACSNFGLLYDQFTEGKKPWSENSTFAYWYSCAWRRSRGQASPATSRAISTASWFTRTFRR